MNQVELEHFYHRRGAEKAAAAMARNEDKGAAHSNPYASAIYRQYVLPLSEIIEKELEPTGHRRSAASVLIKGIDPLAVAYIAIRTALCLTMSGEDNARVVAQAIGQDVHRESTLSVFAEQRPENFWNLNKRLKEKRSKNTRHRSYVMQRAARADGVELPEWGAVDKGHVGYWMLSSLRDIGLLTLGKSSRRRSGKMKTTMYAYLTDEVMQKIESIKETVTEIIPIYFPFVEPPKPWTTLFNGGFHTSESRRLVPSALKAPYGAGRGFAKKYSQGETETLRRAINTLQHVSWRVNKPMLEWLPKIAAGLKLEEAVSAADLPQPPRAEWLDKVAANDMTPEQAVEFKSWKREMANWHTAMKLRKTKWSRYRAATNIATEFKDYESLYFLYQADSRGRKYALCGGINPQGSDMQRALLEFVKGSHVRGAVAREWFLLNGANRFGIDKVSKADRIKWVEEAHDLILACAADPVVNPQWSEADKPFMFLAWCFEYAAWNADPVNFIARQPIGQDGSCNGLQHFSAMLRDSVGGRATNLIPGKKPNDIYAQVASVTMDLLQRQEASPLRDLWLNHGVNRSLCKRSVMTLPYGSTRYSCQDFILDDYLAAGKAPDIPSELHVKAASYLSHIVWAAIPHVVVAASQAMSWLQKASNVVLKDADEIQWITPSGFRVIQRYAKNKELQIRSKLFEGMAIKVYEPTPEIDKRRHKNGIAPNFVHSMDACHLDMVTCACSDEAITSLAMIHDDYGTTPADSERLARLIREKFVLMYESTDPLEQFAMMNGSVPPRPKMGNLDIKQVLDSQYFFL